MLWLIHTLKTFNSILGGDDMRKLIVAMVLSLSCIFGGSVGAFASSAPALATTSSAPCVFESGVVTTCQSSNPQVVVLFDVVGDFSQCTLSIQINWGDGTVQNITGPFFNHVDHLYSASSGTFQIEWTGSVSGVCVFPPANTPGSSSGSYQFTLLPSALLSLTTTVTPKTPMWNIDAQVGLDPTQIACPAALTVTIGLIPPKTIPDICGGQATAPAQTDIYVPVFDRLNPANNLKPSIPSQTSTSAATAQLTDANNQQSSLNATATIPPAPIWVGLGDSFASGHHQTSTQPRCVLPSSCGVVYNDPAFSWLSSAVTQLNAKFSVPSEWQMTLDMEATSGATTAMILNNQDPHMVSQLLVFHQGSWNVVSLNGGADDTLFATDLKLWYSTTAPFSHLEPWDVHSKHKCVNTQDVWLNLQRQASSIIVNLDQVVSDARQADPNVRIATVDYPYVMNADNVCEGDYTIFSIGVPVFHHGAASVINFLDALYGQITGSQIALVDLRSVFGTTNPLQYIQTLSDWGYPHPNPSGEQAIANEVVNAISGL